MKCFRLKNKLLLFALTIFSFSIVGCVEVKPWQKGNLAKKHMAFETDPVESKYIQHMYNSKEAAFGGYGVGGGGCGCN
jgi:Domain of unknown function (DUF4266)